MEIKAWIADNIIRRFKSLGFAGALRWRILYWAYKITGWHIRHKEWDFVLEYLPKLTKAQKVKVLDVGCAKSLFIYEIHRRGYKTVGIDLDGYQEQLPHEIMCFKGDIRHFRLIGDADFVTCISVLEHISIPDQVDALYSIMTNLKTGGRLLLTIPTKEYAQGHRWNGFDYKRLEDILPHTAKIIEYTERAGQICVVITKAF